MVNISNEFKRFLNKLIEARCKVRTPQSQWFNMGSTEQDHYVTQVSERLQEVERSTLSVLAAQYYEMQSRPESINEHLQILKRHRDTLSTQPDTPAIHLFRQQLDTDIQLYSSQIMAMSTFENSWKKALAIIDPDMSNSLRVEVFNREFAKKNQKLSSRISLLEQKLSIQVRGTTFSKKYVSLFAELQAYKSISRRYEDFLAASAAEKIKRLKLLREIPPASDNDPFNITLLLMEERPGYIRMNLSLVNASYDGRFKDLYLHDGKLVVQSGGTINFSFGTAARSLAWQQQYRMKYEPEGARSPSYSPIRSVLVRTKFVKQYFGSHMVSEQNQRSGFKAQILADGRTLKLMNVDRKFPNQIGIEVTGQNLRNIYKQKLILPGALSDLINQYADITSFQTIALEGFHQSFYNPDRDGEFVNIEKLERSVGFTGTLYLLELEKNQQYLSATPFGYLSAEAGKVTSRHLNVHETEQLYKYNAMFFEKIAQLREGAPALGKWYKNSKEREVFEEQLVRLLERNHMTPGGILSAFEPPREGMRDIKGNSLNKVLWEEYFAACVWNNDEIDRLLFELARTQGSKDLDKLLGNSYVQSDIAVVKKRLPLLYEQWKQQAGSVEQRRVDQAKAGRRPSPSVEVFNLSAVERSVDLRLLKLLLKGPMALEDTDVVYQTYVEDLLLSSDGASLRKQVLFHVLCTFGVDPKNPLRPINSHRAVEGNDGVSLSINNRLERPDPYLILNAKSEETQYWSMSDVIREDKYRSYNQFIQDPDKRATAYMQALDTPFVGGISGTTQIITNQLSAFFGRVLTVKQYWQFQMANTAFMIRNGYHSFFETLYVAARYEPEGTGSVGKHLLKILDQCRDQGLKKPLQGELYHRVMELLLPVINQGVSETYRLQVPRFTRFGPKQPDGEVSTGTGVLLEDRLDQASIQGGSKDHVDEVARKYSLASGFLKGRPQPRFTEGRRNFSRTPISGWNEELSAREMKKLFLSGRFSEKNALTLEQQGALTVLIEKKSMAELVSNSLKSSARVAEYFRRMGSIFDRLAPQAFYLPLAGDQYGGRCYPLVMAMAVAVAEGGVPALNNLLDELFLAAANPQSNSSKLLLESLRYLHVSDSIRAATKKLYRRVVQSEAMNNKFTLPEIIAEVEKNSSTSMFALNTSTHSMMVGSSGAGDGRRYHFYDPNFGFFTFAKAKNLSRAMHQHFVVRKMAGAYAASGSKSLPEFDLLKIDTNKMAEIALPSGLTVGDLSKPGQLEHLLDKRQQAKVLLNTQSAISDNLSLRSMLTTLDVQSWGARLKQKTAILAKENGLDHHWLPVISTLKNLSKGVYEIQFVHQKRLNEVRVLSTQDSFFAQFRRYLDTHIGVLKSHFIMKDSQFRSRGSDAAPIDGLNAAFTVQALISWFAESNRRDTASGEVSADLAMALKIHSYLNITQMVHGGVQDITKILGLVRVALRGEAVVAQTSFQAFTSALERAANEGAGMLLGGGMVGLDLYEVIKAENDFQKTVYGTQLAFDSANLVTGVAGLGAGLMGASVAATMLGGAGVVLGGLGVGFTALARVFTSVAEDAKAVGRYFNALDVAYRAKGYRYDAKHQVLLPLAGAVIKTLNLRDGQIHFDSQYIYRTDSVSSHATGSGRRNYFFWAGDMPRMVHDRKQAIEVRSGIGYQSRYPLSHSNSRTVILPGTPKSYISYEYNTLPFTTLRHDIGFDVIRRLESDYRLDYDFYIFPSEWTISSIRQDYVATSIEVVLGKSNQQLVVPELPKELHGYIRYEINGAGGEYLIRLNKGVGVRLSGGPASAASRWVLDSSQLGSEEIIVERNRLVVGKIIVEFDLNHQGQVLLVNRQGEIREIDFTTLRTRVLNEDASKWASADQLKQHLRELADAHQLNGQFVIVENYLEKGQGRGRAFYDVANKRMLVCDAPNSSSQKIHLVAVLREHAYFFDMENATAWRVVISTGQRDVKFAPWLSTQKNSVNRVWQEGDKVYLAQPHLSGGVKAELIYQIHREKMELTSVTGDNELLKSPTPLAYLTNLNSSLGTFSREQVLMPSFAPLVAVHSRHRTGQVQRFWVRARDNMVIKPNLFPPAEQPLQAILPGSTNSAWPIPDDLVLVGSIIRSGAEEAFFFYSKTEKVLFRQEGAGQAVLDALHPTALRLKTPTLVIVLNLNGHLLVVTEDGRIARLNAAGTLIYEAVNEHWLKNRSLWWKDLETVTGSKRSTLAVFGFKGPDGKSALPVWYHNGQVIVAPVELQGRPLQLLGECRRRGWACFFDPHSRKVYMQEPMTPEALSRAFGPDLVFKASVDTTRNDDLLSGVFPETVEKVDGGLRLVVGLGEILLYSNGETQLIAVNKMWQKENASYLISSLMNAASRWRTRGAITLEGEVPSWFDVASRRLYSAPGLGSYANLRFLGSVAEEPAVYLYNTQSHQLYRSDGGDFRQVVSGFTLLNGSLCITEYGRVVRIGAVGQFGAETLNDHWVKPIWWQKPSAFFSDENFASIGYMQIYTKKPLLPFRLDVLAVSGFKQADNKTPLTVFSQGKDIVVLPAEFQNKPLNFLYFDKRESGVWFSDPASGKFYFQPFMTLAGLSSAFGDTRVLKVTARIPTVVEVSAQALGWRTAPQLISNSYEAEHWGRAIVPRMVSPCVIPERAAWWKDLAAVAGNRNTAMAVFGVKGVDGKNMLPVWYYKGLVVVVSAKLQDLPMMFLGFDSEGKGARFFAPVSGKLYYQPAVSTEALARAFGAIEVLQSPEWLPAGGELLPEMQFKAAEQTDDMLSLTTVEGEILELSSGGKLKLVSVDLKWQRKHAARLPQALTELTTRWQASGVLTLHGNAIPKWFDIGSGQLYSAVGPGVHKNLYFVGKALNGGGAYVYDKVTHQLHWIKDNSVQMHMVDWFGKIERVGSTLLFRGDAKSDSKDELVVPLIVGVHTLVLQGGKGADTYRLSDEVWRHYRTLVIDNEDPQQAPDRLILPMLNPKSLLVSRREVDLMLVDASSGRVLLIREVFGSQPEIYKHLQIEMQGHVLSLDQLVKQVAAVGSKETELLNLSQLIKAPILTTPPSRPESPSLPKLTGVMAGFSDSDGTAQNFLPNNRTNPISMVSPLP